MKIFSGFHKRQGIISVLLQASWTVEIILQLVILLLLRRLFLFCFHLHPTQTFTYFFFLPELPLCRHTFSRFLLLRCTGACWVGFFRLFVLFSWICSAFSIQIILTIPERVGSGKLDKKGHAGRWWGGKQIWNGMWVDCLSLASFEKLCPSCFPPLLFVCQNQTLKLSVQLCV